MDVHGIVYNYGSHKHPKVNASLPQSPQGCAGLQI